MEEVALKELLDRLIAQWENEVVEFKDAGDSYSTSDIGKYFSALANEANLRGAERAWLVFGVDNKTRRVVDSRYGSDADRLNGVKHSISQGAEPNMTFREIHLFDHDAGRVLLFEIPAAPRGMPIAWNGHYYARAGESLVGLDLDKQDEIRRQASGLDWSSQLVPDADFIEKFGGASRDDVEKLLLDKLSDGLSEEQKMRKISNLLTAMRRQDIIKNVGSKKVSKWVLGSSTPEKQF